jgi:hypothetical protein
MILQNLGKPLVYNKDEYIERFIPIVLKNAPKFEYFSIYELSKKINGLSPEELKIYKDISTEIRTSLVKKNYAELKGYMLTLTEKGLNYFEDEEKKVSERKIQELTEINLELQNRDFKNKIKYALVAYFSGILSSVLVIKFDDVVNFFFNCLK